MSSQNSFTFLTPSANWPGSDASPALDVTTPKLSAVRMRRYAQAWYRIARAHSQTYINTPAMIVLAVGADVGAVHAARRLLA